MDHSETRKEDVSRPYRGFDGYTPIRHRAKRRRIRIVLQETMYRAARFIAHARRLVLDFGRGVLAHAEVFLHVREHLRATSG